MLGALLRFAAKGMNFGGFSGTLPFGTLFVNLTGSFLLALILTVAFEVRKPNEDIRIGITTGFLGAYTTFSTFCRETADFLASGHYLPALLYVLLSLLLGFGGVYAGIAAGRGAAGHIRKRSGGREAPSAEEDGGTE